VILLRIWVSDDAPAETVRLLVDQLVAVLRRTGASMICSSVEDAAVRQELLAAGFVALPGELGDESRRIILQL
jgi:EAL domain-containing protein (putative c-di-GMP-specific phosphodiesterase class I)